MWTLKSYMDAVPGELVEASLIDGCSKVGTYLRIVLPTSLPGLAVAAFYAFTVSWAGLPVCLRDLRQRSHGHLADLPVSHQ
jgi:ABC-type glycerol-3-phosphate transport system permease component